MQTRILFVEDDPAILSALREKLEMEGYCVDTATDGQQALDWLDANQPDLMILDLMLPRLDGISVLKRLRQRGSSLPVLILSVKGRENEKVAGLRAGADDYLAKPFGLQELLARIEALLRRAHGTSEPFEFGSVIVDPVRRRVFRAGREVRLSRREFDLLLFLIRHRERIVSREEILDAVWPDASVTTLRAVDFHVLNLRHKVEDHPSSPRHIVTRHGFGYQFSP